MGSQSTGGSRLYVQNLAGAWVAVGTAGGNANVPIAIASTNLLATAAGAITAAAANTPGVAVTASTTAQVVLNVATAGNNTFHLVGTAFVGTLIFEASVDAGLNYSPVMCIREDGSGAETGTTLAVAAAFIRQYTAATPGMTYFRVRCSAFTSGSITVTHQPGPFLIEPNPSLGTGNQFIGYAGASSPAAQPLSIFQQYNPYGTARVTVEPTTLFMDPFDGVSLDTQRWITTVGGAAVAPSPINGYLSVAPPVGASVNNYIALSSFPTFVSPGVGFLTFSTVVTLEAAQTNAVNVYRFWGKASSQTPTYTTPIQNGIGFEVEGATGALQCVAYIGTTRYVINSSTPANVSSSVPGITGAAGTALPAGAVGSAYGKALTWQGGPHRYAVMLRSDIAFWFVEGTEVPVAALAYAGPQQQALGLRVVSITNPTATSLANTFQMAATAISDNTAQNSTLSDPVYQFRRATVAPSTHLRATVSTFTSGTTSAGVTTTSSQALASNQMRVGLTIRNDEASASAVYIGLVGPVSPTYNLVLLQPGAYYEMPFGWTGPVMAICATGTATLRISEFFSDSGSGY